MHDQSALRQAIEAASYLCGVKDGSLYSDNTQTRLEKRLDAYWGNSNPSHRRQDPSNLEDETGDSALDAIEVIHQALLDIPSQSLGISAPILGARDLNTLRTLISIFSSWKLTSLVSTYDATLSTLQSATLSGVQSAKLQEIPNETLLNERRKVQVDRYSIIFFTACNVLHRLRRILGLDGEKTEVSYAVLRICSPHIVALAIRLAWGPTLQQLDETGQAERNAAAAILSDLLRTLSTSSCLQILSEAGHVKASKASKEGQFRIPAFVKTAIEQLYSAQLLRTDGIMALFRNIFGSEEEHGSDLLKKLAGVGHLLSTPPPKMSLEAFALINVPRLMDIISELPTSSETDRKQSPSRQSTSTHKTAACFALARIQEVAPEVVKSSTEDIIWKYVYPKEEKETVTFPPFVQAKLIQDAVTLLFQIVEHSEPSTTYLSFLISPVLIPLFTLCAFLKDSQKQKISDVKEEETNLEASLLSMSWSLLKTWLRIAEVKESCDIFSPKSLIGLFAVSFSSVGPILRGGDEIKSPYWDHKDGHLCISWRDAAPQIDIASVLSTLQVKDLDTLLQTEEGSEMMTTPSFLSALTLSPSPPLLANLLKDCSRKDICSQLLNDLIESYTSARQKDVTLKQDTASESVTYVQHILELINTFGSDVLAGQVDKILSFIDFSLGSRIDNGTKQPESGNDQMPTLKAGVDDGPLAGLINIGIKNATTKSDEGTIEEEEPDDDLVETALNLLLALLEGNPDVSPQSHSVLKIISAKLEAQITKSTSSEIHSLAKEARLVLAARQSSKQPFRSSIPTGTPLQQAYAKGNELYQEALRLLQDPILPVRAHGLVLLKELAGYGSTEVGKGILMDPALTSAILDIYIQAIKDDESFLYLNAVKGIAEMANVGGARMIKRLVNLYLGSDKALYTKGEVDLQLRMGEALLQLVQKLEEALLAYIDEIVHPLLTAIRQANRPTTLRSSYLSIIGTCIEACPAAFTSTSFLADAIIDAMLDLLSIESRQKSSITQQQDMQDPTHVDAKLPQLRRAAVLLLALFIRGSKHQLDIVQEDRDQSNQNEGLTALRLPNGTILGGSSKSRSSDGKSSDPLQSLMFSDKQTSRTKSILGYVAQTDSDGLVRHQSQQLLEELELLTLARIAR